MKCLIEKRSVLLGVGCYVVQEELYAVTFLGTGFAVEYVLSEKRVFQHEKRGYLAAFIKQCRSLDLGVLV